VLALEDSGDGEPIVLVHGLGTTRVVWRLVAPTIARRRRVVAIDVPGFGASRPAGRGFDLNDVADTIADGLAAARVPEPFDLLGHSMGGAIALTLAARRPQLVRRLILSAPAGLAPAPALAAAMLGLAGGRLLAVRHLATPLADFSLGRRLLLAFGTLDPIAVAPSQARAMLQAARGSTRIGAALRAVSAADLRPLLEHLSMPLGAIWGREDRVVPFSGAETIRARRPDLVLATVERAGHIAMVEQPRAYACAVHDVLARMSSL
jgi:pimeloyl-ACP methyl ester carboxylesterase